MFLILFTIFLFICFFFYLCFCVFFYFFFLINFVVIFWYFCFCYLFFIFIFFFLLDFLLCCHTILCSFFFVLTCMRRPCVCCVCRLKSSFLHNVRMCCLFFVFCLFECNNLIKKKYESSLPHGSFVMHFILFLFFVFVFC